MELLTFERIVTYSGFTASMPILWLLFKSCCAKELKNLKKEHAEALDEIEELRNKEKQQVAKEKKLINEYLDEKKKALDLKHKVVDLIARNQEAFKDFDDFLIEKGLK